MPHPASFQPPPPRAHGRSFCPGSSPRNRFLRATRHRASVPSPSRTNLRKPTSYRAALVAQKSARVALTRTSKKGRTMPRLHSKKAVRRCRHSIGSSSMWSRRQSCTVFGGLDLSTQSVLSTHDASASRSSWHDRVGRWEFWMRRIVGETATRGGRDGGCELGETTDSPSRRSAAAAERHSQSAHRGSRASCSCGKESVLHQRELVTWPRAQTIGVTSRRPRRDFKQASISTRVVYSAILSSETSEIAGATAVHYFLTPPALTSDVPLACAKAAFARAVDNGAGEALGSAITHIITRALHHLTHKNGLSSVWLM